MSRAAVLKLLLTSDQSFEAGEQSLTPAMLIKLVNSTKAGRHVF